MTIININKYLDRILTILQHDKTLKERVASWRKGDLSEETLFSQNGYPLIFVTTASSFEVERKPLTPQKSINQIPAQMRKYEFWIIIAVGGEQDPLKTQEELYDITTYVESILADNVQLKTPETLTDPLAFVSEPIIQKRFEEYRGKIYECSNVRLLVDVVVE